MLAEFSHVPASCACSYSRDSWVLFWAQGRFSPQQRCWGAAILLPHVQKESATQKNCLFLLHPLNSSTRFAKLISAC